MNILNLTGFSLFYVGVVLFINGLWLLNKLSQKEIIFIDFFIGLISFLVGFNLVLGAKATVQTIEAGTFTFLFSCTYFWVAFNQYMNCDGRGLGWFCLFVAITAVPITIIAFEGASSTWGIWFSICWAMWALLWFVYFLNLVFGIISNKIVGWITITIGITTAWLPGFLLTCGYIK
jgi:hypothetical protein